jgi:hypothetical protein
MGICSTQNLKKASYNPLLHITRIDFASYANIITSLDHFDIQWLLLTRSKYHIRIFINL